MKEIKFKKDKKKLQSIIINKMKNICLMKFKIFEFHTRKDLPSLVNCMLIRECVWHLSESEACEKDRERE